MSRSETQLVGGLLSLAEGLSASRPLDERLTALCRITAELLSCDRSSLFLLREGHYHAAYNFGNPLDVAARFPHHRVSVRDPLISLAMRTRRHVIVNDVASSSLVDPQTARRARIQAIVVAPLFDASQQPLGFLTAEYNENPGRFTETMSTMVLGFAKLAEIAIVSQRRDEERERAERERASMHERLLEWQRIESLGRLAGGLAHDFNNLLTVILGHAEFLKREIGEPALLTELEQIEGAAERARLLTHQLLALGRRQVLQPRTIDLDRLVFGLEPMLRRAIPSNVAVVIKPARDVQRVRADPVQLERVILNLVLNARDAMPSGGRLTLAIENVELDEEFCRARRNARPGPYVVLSVSDTGAGMDAETRERVFEPFFTTKETGRGFGLGLSSVLGIVEQSGGHLTVESAPDQGTTFRVHLPGVEEPSEALASPAPAPSPSLTGTETVLVADDDPGVRRVARRILESRGYTVLEAASGDDALAVSAGRAAPIHLLMSDAVMPGINVRELAERLKALRPELRVLFVSGHAENAIVRGGILDPNVEFLAKPFTPHDLARRVRAVLDAPTPSSSES